MSLFSGLGNILHGVASFFEGDDLKKKQQQQQQQAAAPVQATPAQSVSSGPPPGLDNFITLPSSLQKAQPAPKPVGPVANPAQPAPALSQPLAKATPPPTTVNSNPPAPAAPVQKPSFLSSTINTLKKAVRPFVPAPILQGYDALANSPQGQGAALGAGRAVSGIVQGAADLPNAGASLEKFIVDKTPIVPGPLRPAASQYVNLQKAGIQKVTSAVDKPFNDVNKHLDTLADEVPGRRDTYVPAQIATNVATLIPGVAEAGALGLEKLGVEAPNVISTLQKVGQFGRLGSALDATEGAEEAITGSNAANDLRVGADGVPGAPETAPSIEPAPGEASPGVKSANPTQAADAAAQTAEKVATSPVVTPTDIATPPTTLPTVETPPAAPGAVENAVNLPKSTETPVVPVHTPTTPITPEIPTTPVQTAPPAVNPEPTVPVASTIPTPADVAKAVAEGKPVPGVPDANGNPTLVSDAAAARAAEAAGVAPVPPAPLLPGDVAEATGRTAPNAPNLREQLVKQLGEAGKLAGDTTEHNVLSNAELDQAANRVVQSTPTDELLNKYSGVPNIANAVDLAHAKASLPVLADLSKEPETAAEATKAIDNILEGTEKHVSGSARSLNYSQSMYDSLPREAKVSLTIRTLDKAREAAGMPLIADNLPLRAEIEDHLNSLLAAGEDLQSKLAAVQGEVVKIQEAASAGQAPADAAAQLKDLGQQNASLELQAKVQNNETARFYNSLVPGKAGLEKAADFARTSMLTAPSGRINNVFNVGGNSLYEIARSLPESVLNKLVNAARGGGTTEDQSLLNEGLKTGFKEGLSKVKAQLQGSDLAGTLRKGNVDTGPFELNPTSDNKGFNKITNVVHALVKAPSDVIGGAIKNAQLTRMARAEGQAAGLAGDELEIYTKARSIVPSRQMTEKAQLLQDQVSHMNKNPLADATSAATRGIEKLFGDSANAKGAAGLIKNTFLPFPKYAATFVWNTLADRNVVADTVHVAQALRDGDTAALTKALSGGALDSAIMYIGYHLADMGLITNKDGNGYSDDGQYLHIGNRYIPLGLIGVPAEGLLAGTAIHNAVHGGGNPITSFVSTIANTAFDTIKAAGAQNLVGAGDQGIQALQNAFTGSNGVSPLDAAAVVGGQAVGQFIPGAASDINAFLNHSGLNPTGEAADTKVVKDGLTPTGEKSTAKNIPASELKSLANRIPVLSQSLPRKVGTTANDFIDRVTRGSHIGPSQGAELQKVQDVADRVKANTDAGVPDPEATYKKGDSFNDAVENRIENKNYDQAVKGLQAKLADVKSQPDVTSKKTDPIEKQIKEVQVLQAGNFDPAVRDLYSKTSLTEWRDMGDPKSSSYDPSTYQLLYNYDSQLAKAGVSSASSKPSENKYTAKGAGKGGSGGKSKVGSVGSPVNLGDFSFGDLAPKKITDPATKIPTVAPQLLSGKLIKKRAISVTPG